jgi:hypothetical protein
LTIAMTRVQFGSALFVEKTAHGHHYSPTHTHTGTAVQTEPQQSQFWPILRFAPILASVPLCLLMQCAFCLLQSWVLHCYKPYESMINFIRWDASTNMVRLAGQILPYKIHCHPVRKGECLSLQITYTQEVMNKSSTISTTIRVRHITTSG